MVEPQKGMPQALAIGGTPARTAICVCGQAGPLLQGLLLSVPAVMAAVVVMGRSLAGWGTVQGSAAEMSHVGTLGRQCGDGALHGAGVGGRLRVGCGLAHSLREGPGAGSRAALQAWGSGTTRPLPLPRKLFPTQAHPFSQSTLHKVLSVSASGAQRAVGLSVPGGQGGCQEEVGCGPGWENPEGWLRVMALLGQGHGAPALG